MTRTEEPDDAVVAERDGIECPLCHSEIDQPLDDHLLGTHDPAELADLAARFVREREESGLSR